MTAAARNDRITERLAEHVLGLRHEALPGDARRVARQCLLDWIGVTLAGSSEELTRILSEEAAEQGGHPDCTLVGQARRAPSRQAALINGAASHALDYDDVNFHLTGHPTVTLVPGLLALAEQRGSSGAAFLAAFVAGYEMAARVGAMVSPSHYDRGFHATATVGCFAAAAACGHLLGLDCGRLQTALGIAATRAAGLKSMFGTMCKPLHAGTAAEAGLWAALLAAKGFTARQDALECPQGFAATHAEGIDVEAALTPPPSGLHIHNNLFKYHAACYQTHAPIECARRLREQHGLRPEEIAHIRLRLEAGADKMCNIPNPTSGLEAKFSLRQTLAFALSGVDTASLATFSDANARDPRFADLRDKVEIDFARSWKSGTSDLMIETVDGRRLEISHDSSVPMRDLDAQERLLVAKFRSLAEPVLGAPAAERVAALVAGLDTLGDLRGLAAALRPPLH